MSPAASTRFTSSLLGELTSHIFYRCDNCNYRIVCFHDTVPSNPSRPLHSYNTHLLIAHTYACSQLTCNYIAPSSTLCRRDLPCSVPDPSAARTARTSSFGTSSIPLAVASPSGPLATHLPTAATTPTAAPPSLATPTSS